MLLNGYLTSLVGESRRSAVTSTRPHVDLQSRSAFAKEPAGSTARRHWQVAEPIVNCPMAFQFEVRALIDGTTGRRS
jgi:hypothetical protein